MSIGLFSPETVEIMAKYGLEFNPMDMGASVRSIQDKAWEIQSLIESAKDSQSETVKVANHPYDVKASTDKSAMAVAANLMKGFLTACEAAIDKNPNVAYALKELGDAITGYFQEEVTYRRLKAAPTKAPTSNSQMDVLYDDRKVLVKAVQGLILGMPMLTEACEMKDGKVKLPNLQGAGGSKKSDAPTGRYAKWSGKSVKWIIDGTEYPGDTHWSDLLRLIWQGADRVGKKASDLFDPIDKARKKTKSDTEPVTVTINKHEVTYQHIPEVKS